LVRPNELSYIKMGGYISEDDTVRIAKDFKLN